MNDYDGELTAVFFIVYEYRMDLSQFDRSFTVTLDDDTVIPSTDAELVEDGYAYLDMMGEEIAGYAGALVSAHFCRCQKCDWLRFQRFRMTVARFRYAAKQSQRT